MARPRVLRTQDGGEITLKNITPELADKIKGVLEGGATEAVAPATEEAAPAPKADVSTLRSTALGIFQDPKNLMWSVAVVKYNPETQSAAVEKVVKVGPEKAEAAERYKILSVETGLVV